MDLVPGTCDWDSSEFQSVRIDREDKAAVRQLLELIGIWWSIVRPRISLRLSVQSS